MLARKAALGLVRKLYIPNFHSMGINGSFGSDEAVGVVLQLV
jgi:hypothetical protein